jgi:hypothetical protein
MVTTMSIPTVAAARPRVLSTPWSDAFAVTPPTNDNSIALTGVAPVNAGRGVYSAKQAAPPRGVPR